MKRTQRHCPPGTPARRNPIVCLVCNRTVTAGHQCGGVTQ
jgi:hypothetical protein